MKVSDYGDLLSQITHQPLLAYEEYGSYQGDYIAILDAGDTIDVWKGSYGSCSGCDWLEAKKDWNTSEVPLNEANSYIGSDHPFLQIPKEVAKELSLNTLCEILPANTRTAFDTNWSDIKLPDLLSIIHKAAQ